MMARLPTGLIWPWQLIWNLHTHISHQHSHTRSHGKASSPLLNADVKPLTSPQAKMR